MAEGALPLSTNALSLTSGDFSPTTLELAGGFAVAEGAGGGGNGLAASGFGARSVAGPMISVGFRADMKLADIVHLEQTRRSLGSLRWSTNRAVKGNDGPCDAMNGCTHWRAEEAHSLRVTLFGMIHHSIIYVVC